VLGGVGDGLAGGGDDRPERLAEVAVAHADHLDGHAVGVLDVGGDAAQGAGDRALVGGVPGVQPGPQVALLRAASLATVFPSPAFFWISASVCSTESCRWAATSARSWVRTRSARSAVRSDASR
jgi:hypothetical protein